MRTISFSDALGILRNMLKPEKELDAEITRFFKRQFSGDFLVVKKGRTAFQALITDFNLQNTEMIIPSWICADVFGPLCIQNNITPKAIDCIQGTFTSSIKEAERIITPKTKSLLLVHTYGIPQDPRPWKELCKKYGLILIEDCAHSISLKYSGKYLGTYGDAAIVSFVKEMPNFIGGVYINNKRSIRETVKKSILPAQLRKEDFLTFLNTWRITKKLSLIRRLLSKKTKISNLFRKVELEDLSKIGKAIFCYYAPKLKIEEKRKAGKILFQHLSQKKVSAITLQQLEISSGKCFPLFIREKQKVLQRLRHAGFSPGEGWVPSLTNFSAAKKEWALPAAKVAESYEKRAINIDLDEILEEKARERFLSCLNFKKNGGEDRS